jgi:hypothetical protein
MNEESLPVIMKCLRIVGWQSVERAVLHGYGGPAVDCQHPTTGQYWVFTRPARLGLPQGGGHVTVTATNLLTLCSLLTGETYVLDTP